MIERRLMAKMVLSSHIVAQRRQQCGIAGRAAPPDRRDIGECQSSFHRAAGWKLLRLFLHWAATQLTIVETLAHYGI